MDETIYPVAVLKAPGQPQDLSAYARSLVSNMEGNVLFSSPTPALATVTAAADALDKDESNALNRAKGAVAKRNASMKKLKKTLRGVVAYVQSVADLQLTREDAIAVITASGLGVKKVTKRTKPDFAVTHGAVSGEVELSCKALRVSASYYWSFSLDQKSWTSVPETMQASTTISGLTPGQTYYFRLRKLTRTGMGDYSQVVSLLVL